MDEHAWDLVKTVFSRALEIPEESRAAFVADACSGDAGVQAEVESLLEAHLLAEMEAGTADARPAFAGAVPGASMVGRQVGAYRLVELIGAGGMGMVYLGERADGSFERRVAVKLIRPGMDTGDIVRRFELERHTLARLEHPHIARLLDAGTTGAGQPYLVMEHVDGEPIDVYCDSRRLDVSARLRLLLDVCDAVQHAHRNLVVHRDLKPGNILVTGDGTVKLLDFGIGKLLSPDPTAEPTRSSTYVMTPGYASPEQLLGRPVSTATDVYCLGVVAYELLTGHLPHPLAGSTLVEIVQAVSERPPRRPSSVVLKTEAVRPGAEDGQAPVTAEAVAASREESAERLRKRLAGEIDLILLTALHVDPERRYPSVGHLAEDIRRHLEGLPIAAHPDRAGYRLRKLLGRHRLGAAAAAVIALLLAAGVAGTAWQAGVAAEERDRARAEARRAVAVTEFLERMLTSADPWVMGREVTVAEVLDRTARTVGAELRDQPEIEATVRVALGRTYQSLGRYDPAEDQLERAAELVRSVHDDGHPEAAEVLGSLASLRHDQGRLEEADHLCARALEILERTGAASTLAAADILNSCGALRRAQGRDDEAENLYRTALRIVSDSPDPRGMDVAMLSHNLAVLHHGRGELDEAETLYREALNVTRSLHGDDNPAVASCMHSLASVLHSRGEHAEAESLYRRSFDLRRRLLGPDHPAVLLSQVDLAELLADRGDVATAGGIAADALALSRRVLDRGHPLHARTLVVAAEVALAAGDPVAAEEAARESLEIRRSALGPEHWLVANAEVLVGRSLAAQRRYDAAEELLLRGREILAADRGDDHELTVAAAEALAALRRARTGAAR